MGIPSVRISSIFSTLLIHGLKGPTLNIIDSKGFVNKKSGFWPLFHFYCFRFLRFLLFSFFRNFFLSFILFIAFFISSFFFLSKSAESGDMRGKSPTLITLGIFSPPKNLFRCDSRIDMAAPFAVIHGNKPVPIYRYFGIEFYFSSANANLSIIFFNNCFTFPFHLLFSLFLF